MKTKLDVMAEAAVAALAKGIELRFWSLMDTNDDPMVVCYGSYNVGRRVVVQQKMWTLHEINQMQSSAPLEHDINLLVDSLLRSRVEHRMVAERNAPYYTYP